MASSFHFDAQLCKEHVQFASYLEKWNFRIIYWTMFAVNLIVLFFGSWVYSKLFSRVHGRRRDGGVRPFGAAILRRRRPHVIVLVDMDHAASRLTGRHYRGHLGPVPSPEKSQAPVSPIDFTHRLLPTVGNPLSHRADLEPDPGHWHWERRQVQKLPGLAGNSSDEEQGPRISQANTIANPGHEEKCEDVHAEFIGFTVQGGPVVRFTQPVAEMRQGEFLGRDDDGGSTFAFPRGSIRFETGPSNMTASH
ncbi:uncharacterized protein MAM_03489 [Metarhizium album ARSEF 1941]|uniref:Uncharacterized protein n=1 Tax=Metarhizium album (strain ARSEF 1941) TaxID=1081103 RepID=A0A0B2WZV6_METAS|nr:uncharacterized protein MAM_03489 [Metarhizium album ARSEF 1941]KHN98365.1 hypothetical protein MAM_03489 [Metarhizium album ARSEF 1941]